MRTVLSAAPLVDLHSGDDHHTDASGHELHVLTTLPNAVADADSGAGVGGANVAAATAPLSETFLLHSNPGAQHTIYLDFDGHVTSGTIWNSSFNGGEDFATPAYDFDGNLSSFSDQELQRIQYIWQRVAEDFLPFDVNVTTEDPGVQALTKSGSGDSQWGVRVAIGGSSSDWFGSSAGGVAYVGSFNWSSDTPTFVFEAQLSNGNEKYTAEAISHEAGHTLGLRHDGRVSPSEEYYQGHGSGETGWAPLMGASYYKNLSQWSRGEYLSADNSEDDLAIIAGNNGFDYRADDHGDTNASASPLLVLGSSVNDAGIIETNSDIDVFTFSTEAGAIQLDLSPADRGPNLDILAELYDASFSLVASANPTGLLGASLSATVSAGQYYLHVSGAGEGDPLAGGYTDYGSLGQYSVSGTIVPVDYDTLSIAPINGSQAEGDAGATEFTFAVNRSGNVDGTTTVEYVVQGSGSSAADAADFGGSLASGTLSFGPGEVSKTITLQVSGDVEIENDEGFTVALRNASGQTQVSNDTAAGLIINDDIPAAPGILVTPTSGLTTRESGTTATFEVRLDSRPSANVTIAVQSMDTTEGTVDKSVLTFTPDDWDSSQTVTVTGVDDTVRDSHVTYNVQLAPAQSGDDAYAGMDADDVEVTNQDDEKGKKDGGGGGGGGGKGGGKGGRKGAPIFGNAVVASGVLSPDAAWFEVNGVNGAGGDHSGRPAGAERLPLATEADELFSHSLAAVDRHFSGIDVEDLHEHVPSNSHTHLELDDFMEPGDWTERIDAAFRA